MKVLTICGSMKFSNEMQNIAWDLEANKGYSVIQCVYNIDDEIITEEKIMNLNHSHYKKIDLCDAIYVVNINGYIGSQVKKEIEYALSKGKEIIYHVNPN